MASALDQELSCSICLELFKDPVTLPCMHSFCRECLLSMLIPKQSEDSTDAVCNIKQQDLDGDHSGRVIQCPECRYIAILDEGGVHKLPRNYTLANIVEKYGKPIEEKLTIPCDICDETPPAKACKHCKECQISYCIQCLFLHPKRGVLSKHNLIDPQCQEIQHSNDELEKICLICKCTVTKSDTHKEHSENVVSKETAVNKILSRYSASLNKKRKDVIDNMHSIEVSLQDMRKNYGKKFKDLMERKTSAEKKGMEHLGELQSSLDHISDMMLKVTNQTKTEDFDIMELFKMEESLGKLGNQFTQFSPVDDIGQNVQESNATSVIPDPASSLDKVADDVDTTSLTNKPTPVPASAFPNVATESNETSHSIHCEKIVIKDCVPVLSNSNLGAWLLVTWDTLNTDYLYELKFTCDTVEGGDIHITKGIQGSKHTQTLLRYDTRYIVTVSVMGAEQTESDGFQIKTQQQITCGQFQFSPVLTSENIELNWKGEVLTSEDNKWPERDLHRIQGGAGTLLLHVYQSTQY